MTAKERANRLLVLAWALAIIPNALVAFGADFDGPWMAVRYVLSALFLVALAAWIVVWVRGGRTRTP